MMDLAYIDAIYDVTRELAEKYSDKLDEPSHESLLGSIQRVVQALSDESLIASTMVMFSKYGVTAITFGDDDESDEPNEVTYKAEDVNDLKEIQTRLVAWRELEEKLSNA